MQFNPLVPGTKPGGGREWGVRRALAGCLVYCSAHRKCSLNVGGGLRCSKVRIMYLTSAVDFLASALQDAGL